LQAKLSETEEKLGARNDEFDALQAKLEDFQPDNQETTDDEIERLRSQLEKLSGEARQKDELADKLQEIVGTLTTERDHSEVEVQTSTKLSRRMK
jgi:DNA-binding transcriptional regulator GbsR (MarR family)